jgi:serine/threonine-protein kinase
VLTHYEDGNADSLTERGRAAAARALELDSTLAEAWTAKAYGNTQHWNNAQAESDFQRAIQYDSTFATARFWHGLLLEHVGRTNDALREIDAAIRLEPTSLVILSGRAQMLGNERRFEEALAANRGVLELDSTYALVKFGLGWVLSQSGQHEEAIRVLRAVVAVPGVRPSEVQGTLAMALARGGRASEARDVIARVRRAVGDPVVPSGAVAAALFELGDRDAAIASLEAAVNRHDPWLVNFSRGPRYDKVRTDPRGKALLESTERP